MKTSQSEALTQGIDFILLQETKMKKEEEQAFNFNKIHENYLVEVDNLSLQERIEKRNHKQREGEQDPVRAPQANVVGSEGQNGPQPFSSTHPIGSSRLPPNYKTKSPWSSTTYMPPMKQRHMPCLCTTKVIIAGDFNATITRADHVNFSGGKTINSPNQNTVEFNNLLSNLSKIRLSDRSFCC